MHLLYPAEMEIDTFAYALVDGFFFPYRESDVNIYSITAWGYTKLGHIHNETKGSNINTELYFKKSRFNKRPKT